MAMQQYNIFSKTILTPEEEASGSVFNTNQILVLRNKLADIAIQKLNQESDPDNYIKFARDEAFLRGQMSAIQWILDTSDAVSKQLLEEAQEVARQQSLNLSGNQFNQGE